MGQVGKVGEGIQAGTCPWGEAYQAPAVMARAEGMGAETGEGKV